jgi:hypothetical protein
MPELFRIARREIGSCSMYRFESALFFCFSYVSRLNGAVVALWRQRETNELGCFGHTFAFVVEINFLESFDLTGCLEQVRRQSLAPSD